MWEMPHHGRRRRIVRGAGETAANLIDDNDEILVGIERTPFTDIDLLDDLVGARIPGGNEYGVIVGGIEGAKSGVGEFTIADSAALFQIEIPMSCSSYEPCTSCEQ